MPDALFADPRLAPLYDAFDDDRSDLQHYVALVRELGAGSVLDVGCGTGSLAVLLARVGVRVVGVDPAAASLDVARGKPEAELVEWHHTDGASLPPVQVDLVVMTGNVAQVFVEDDAWLAVLRAARAVLAPDGHLVFEARRPEQRAWEQWRHDAGPVLREVPGTGSVEQRFELLEVDPPLVSFRYTYSFLAEGTTLTSDSTLVFRSREEIERSLQEAGFGTPEVREAPDRPGLENVFIARPA